MKAAIDCIVIHVAERPRQQANTTNALLDSLLGRTQRVGYPVHSDAKVVADKLVVLHTRVVLG